MSTPQNHLSNGIELYLYYGMKIVGQLFFVVGIVFLLILWKVLTTAADAEERSFLLVFVAVASLFTMLGGGMILLSRFLQKPEIPENSAGISTLARTFRILAFVGMGMSISSILPILLILFFMTDVRDWRSWREVPETGVIVSREDTGVLVGEAPRTRYVFRTSDESKQEFTGESCSTREFRETDSLPLERSGSLYRIRGSRFGILDSASTILLLGMLTVLLAIFVISARGARRLHAFCKRSES